MDSVTPLKSAFVFVAIDFIRPALGVLLVPIYLLYLDPKDYGVIALLSIFSSLLSLLGSLKLDTAMRVKFFDYYDNSQILYSYLQNVFTVTFLLSIFWYSILLFFGPSLFQLIFPENNIDFYPYGLVACISGLSNMCLSPFLVYLKNKVRLKEFSLLNLFIVITTISLQLYFITILEWGVLGVLLGNAIPVVATLFFILLRNNLFLFSGLNFKMVRESLAFSMPLLPYVMLDFIVSKGDRYFINMYLDLDRVGLYSILMTIVGLISIVYNSLDNAIRPILYDCFIKDSDNKLKIMSLFNLYVLIGITGLYSLMIIGNHIELITNKEIYLSIKPYFGLAILSMLPVIFVRIFNFQMMYLKKSKDISKLTFYKVIAIVLLFVILIPQFELWGVLIAILVSNVFSAIVFGVKSYQHGGITYKWNISIAFCLVFISSVLSFYIIEYANRSIWMLVEFGFLVVVSIATYYKYIEAHLAQKS